MELTLREARKLELSLRDLSVSNQIIQVRAYDEEVALEDIQLGIQDVKKEIEDKVRMSSIRYLIKKLINAKNMECGISDMLNVRDFLHSARDIYNTVGQEDSVERQVEYIKNHPEAHRMVCVISDVVSEEVDRSLVGVEEELTGISRSLNERNNIEVISLGLDDVTFLQENNIL